MRRGVVLAVLSLTLLASGCSLGARETWAEIVRGSHERAAGSGGAKVHVETTVKVIETTIRITPQPLFASADGVVDFDGDRAMLEIRDPKVYRGRKLLFDDLVAFVPRSEASVRTDGRHWMRFDFRREPKEPIDSTDRRVAVGAGLISPALTAELLGGALAGSLERAGGEAPQGERAGTYTMRISVDAAARKITDEDRQDGFKRLFETLGITADVFEAEADVDERGLPRRVRFVLRQQKDRVNAFEMTETWTFSDYGTPAAVGFPDASDTTRPARFRETIEDFTREGT